MIQNNSLLQPGGGFKPPPPQGAILQPPPNPNLLKPQPEALKPAPMPSMIQPQKIVPKPQTETLNIGKLTGFSSSSDIIKIQQTPIVQNSQSLVGTFQPLMSQKSFDGSYAINSSFARAESASLNDQKKEIDKHGFLQDEISLADAFMLKPIRFKEQLPETVFQQVVMQNNRIWIYTQRSNLLIKTELDAATNAKTPYQVVDDQNMRQKRVKLKKMFVDNMGLHCFMLTGHEIFYNHFNSTSVHQLQIESVKGSQVAFRSIDILKFSDSDPLFFECVLGSEEGHLFFGVIQVDPQRGYFPEVVEKFRPILQTPDYSTIFDIKITQIKEVFLVLAISATKLYQFVGHQTLAKALEAYATDANKIKTQSISILAKPTQKPVEKKSDFSNNRSTAEASSASSQSTVATGPLSDPLKLQFFYDKDQVAGFGWMNDSVFCYSQYQADKDDASKTIAKALILKNEDIRQIEYLRKEGDQPVEGEVPTGFTISLFHICFMYSNNITVISKISRQIVYSQNFKDEKLLRGIHLDIKKNQLLAYSHSKIISVANLLGEDKDAWKYYLKKGKIKQAIAVCKTATQRAQVNGSHADTLFSSGSYQKAAQFYALSNYSFEAVAMKFMKWKNTTGLEFYIEKVLEVYKKSTMSTNNEIQRKVLCTWLVELKLAKINEYKAQNSQQNQRRMDDDEPTRMMIEQQKATIHIMETDFHKFLIENQADLDQDTILQLLQAHGKIDDCIKYADAMKQYQKLIVHYINKQEFKKALKKLNQIESTETRNYEMTKYMSVMIKKAPNETLNALESEKFRKIDLTKLMPALRDCPDEARARARQFVQNHCIKQRKSQDSSVHNMCFYLYAKSDNSDELLDYLKKEEINFNSGMQIYFDKTYALNVCRQFQNEAVKQQQPQDRHSSDFRRLDKNILNLKKAQIILYGIMGVFGKAVELALECGDQDLARDYANKPMDRKVARELWMSIARYLFSNENKNVGNREMNVQKALEFIRKNSRLKVEDLLETFPKEAKVEEMKEHLCNCLEDYEKKITALRGKIEKNSHNAEQLRNQKRSQRNKHITINPSQCCDICYATVFDREFYVFPCLHAFHRECISTVLKDPTYQPKDPKVKVIVNQIKGEYGKINSLYQMNKLSMQEGSSSLINTTGGNNDEKGIFSEIAGITSGITNFFTESISLKGAPSGMQLTNELQFNSYIKKTASNEQIKIVQDCLNKVDSLIKSDCFFCGPILIDMIDNDIEFDGKGSEFSGSLFSSSDVKSVQASEWGFI